MKKTEGGNLRKTDKRSFFIMSKKRIPQTEENVNGKECKEKSTLENWKEKKDAAVRISEKMKKAKLMKRSKAMKECSTILIKRVCECGNTHIQTANLCRDRLCPICSWRLSIKRYANMLHIMDFVNSNSEQHYNYYFLTLTIRNCRITSLNETVKDMSSAWNRLLQRKLWKECICGFARSVEVTYNYDRKNFHPHFHIIVAVKEGTSIGLNEIRKAWKEVLRIKYNPITDFRKIYHKKQTDKNEKDITPAILETFKYSVKSKEVENMPLNAFRALAEQISSLRLISFGGIFKEAKRILGLEFETITEEEISIRKDYCSRCGTQMQEVILRWAFDSKTYDTFAFENL